MCRELQARNYRLIEGLAEAARKIQRQDKVIELLKEENENLRNGDYAINITPQIGALKERIQQLEWELEVLRKGLSVELPRNVAECIKTLKLQNIDNASIIYQYASGDRVNYQTTVGKTITDFACDNFDVFLSALVNGYTVAPEPEKDIPSNIRSEVTEIIKYWMGTPPVADGGNDAERLTDWIFDHFQRHGDDQLPF